MAASATLATMPRFANVSPLDNLFLNGKTAPAWQNGSGWQGYQGKNPLGNVFLATASAKWRQNQRNGGKFGMCDVLFV